MMKKRISPISMPSTLLLLFFGCVEIASAEIYVDGARQEDSSAS